MRWVLRSKIHNATVTDANIDYIGSLTVDADLTEKAGFWSGEEVLVVSNTTGVRLETYLISGERSSSVIAANGAAAHLLKAGDQAAPVPPYLAGGDPGRCGLGCAGMGRFYLQGSGAARRARGAGQAGV